MKYDCIIVGAGPAGYFASYELTKLNKDAKVLLLEKGHDIFNRRCPLLLHKVARCPENKNGIAECYPHCSITCGFGGAGAYSDGKFNVTTDFGGWLGNYVTDEELLDLINYVDSINLEFGATREITNPYTDKVKEIEKRAMSVGVKLLKAKVRHIGTEENIKILERITNYLKDKIEMRFKTLVKDLIIENNEIKGVILDSGEEIYSDRVLLATGREGSKWLSEMFTKYNIAMGQTQVDIGVRVETSNMIMEEINDALYEAKFLFKSSDDLMVRTFCSNPSGHVVIENYEGVQNVNGHSYNDSSLGSNNTNFALLVSHHFTEPFKKPNEFAMKVSSLANQLACGSVIVQRYGDLCARRRTTASRLKEGFIEPTLKEAVPGDLELCMPLKTLDAIKEMIQVLDKITPGIATEHTLLYGVEAKYYATCPDCTNTLEVKSVKGLYVAGDGAGITRGLAQAGASGVLVARNILK